MPKKKKHGWIRGYKTHGITYYYYCTTAADGSEKKEYLGTAERIFQAVQNSYRQKQG